MSIAAELVTVGGKQVRRVLVTGGAGFIGSHLTSALLARGASVTVLDDLSTGRLESIQHVSDQKGFQFRQGSVLDEDVVAELVQDADVVFHLAAAVGVGLIMSEPIQSIETIVGGTRSVLHACEREHTPVLITSSSEVYGKGTQVPFREDDDVVTGATTKQRWAYACAKSLDEFMAHAWHRQTGTPVFIARLFNTVGPGQVGEYGMVVPRFVQAALRGAPLTIHGDGEQTRCFANVADVVPTLIRMACTTSCAGQVINIGSDEEVTLNHLAGRIIKLTASRSEIRHLPYSEVYGPGFEDMRRRVPSLEKARRLLDYAPRCSLEDTLLEIIAEEKEAMLRDSTADTTSP